MNKPTIINLQIDEITKICRICLSTSDTVNILNAQYENIPLTNIFEITFNDSVNINVKGPISLCQQCLNSLLHFYHFVVTYKRNKPILEQLQAVAEAAYTNNDAESSFKDNEDVEDTNEDSKVEIKQEIFDDEEKETDIPDPISIQDNISEDHGYYTKRNKVFPKASICRLCRFDGKKMSVNQSPKNFNRHYLKKHFLLINDSTFRCDKCKMDFPSLTEMQEHYFSKEHQNKVCLNCKESFSTMASLYTHCRDCKKWDSEVAEEQLSYFCHFCKINIQTFEEVIEHYNEKNHRIADKCMLCNESQKRLPKHFFSHRPKSLPYVCYGCNLVFAEHEEWEKHNSETNHTRIKCRLCGKSVARRHIYSHLKRHAGINKKHTCDVCGKVYSGTGNLQRHQAAAHKGKRYYCDKCPSSFTTAGILRVHIDKKHYGLKSTEKKTKIYDYSYYQRLNTIICELCGERLFKYDKRKLALHDAYHKFGHKFICKIGECLKTFPDQRSQVKHKNEHDRYPCDECNRTFFDINNLKIHSFYHIWTNNFVKSAVIKCFICNNEFPNPDELSSHIKSQYGLHVCIETNCFKVFSTKLSYKNHALWKHSNIRKSSKRIINRKDISQINPTLYAQRSFVCKVCNRRFAKIQQLRIHSRVHTGEKPYECDYCGKTFAYSYSKKLHEKTHTGEKPFSCKYCDKSYTAKKSLEVHQALHCIPKLKATESLKNADENIETIDEDINDCKKMQNSLDKLLDLV